MRRSGWRNALPAYLLRNPGLSARSVTQHLLGSPCWTFLQSSQGRGISPIFWQAFTPMERGFHQPVLAADFPIARTRSAPVFFPATDMPQGKRRDPLCVWQRAVANRLSRAGTGLPSVYHGAVWARTKKWR